MIKNKAPHKRPNTLVIKTLSIILILIFIITGCHSSNTELKSTRKNTTGKYDTTVVIPAEVETGAEEETGLDQDRIDPSLYLEEIIPPYNGTEDNEYLKTVQEVARVMVENKFIYDLSGIGSSLDKALRKKHHGDCAHLVSWSLQESGVLEKGQTFYAKKKGALSCKIEGKTYRNLTQAADIIEVEGIPFSDQDRLKAVLKVGDICCYNKHMNVVAGLDDDGNVLYYDAGLTPVEGHKPGGRYTDQLTEPYSRPKSNNRLYTIIRLRQDP